MESCLGSALQMRCPLFYGYARLVAFLLHKPRMESPQKEEMRWIIDIKKVLMKPPMCRCLPSTVESVNAGEPEAQAEGFTYAIEKATAEHIQHDEKEKAFPHPAAPLYRVDLKLYMPSGWMKALAQSIFVDPKLYMSFVHPSSGR